MKKYVMSRVLNIWRRADFENLMGNLGIGGRIILK
jgi:hypothetical protein